MLTPEQTKTYERESNQRAGYDPDELETDPVRTLNDDDIPEQ